MASSPNIGPSIGSSSSTSFSGTENRADVLVSKIQDVAVAHRSQSPLQDVSPTLSGRVNIMDLSQPEILNQFGNYKRDVVERLVDANKDGMLSLLDAINYDAQPGLTINDVIDLLERAVVGDTVDTVIDNLIELLRYAPLPAEVKVIQYQAERGHLNLEAGNIAWDQWLEENEKEYKSSKIPDGVSAEKKKELVNILSLDQVCFLDEMHANYGNPPWMVQFLENLTDGNLLDKLYYKLVGIEHPVVHLSLEKMVREEGGIQWDKWIDTPALELKAGLIDIPGASQMLKEHLAESLPLNFINRVLKNKLDAITNDQLKGEILKILEKVTSDQLQVFCLHVMPVAVQDRQLLNLLIKFDKLSTDPFVGEITQQNILDFLVSFTPRNMIKMAPHLIGLIDQKQGLVTLSKMYQTMTFCQNNDRFIELLNTYATDNGGNIDWNVWCRASEIEFYRVISVNENNPDFTIFYDDLQKELSEAGIDQRDFNNCISNVPLTVAVRLQTYEAIALYQTLHNLRQEDQNIVCDYIRDLNPTDFSNFILNIAPLANFSPQLIHLLMLAPLFNDIAKAFVFRNLLAVPAPWILDVLNRPTIDHKQLQSIGLFLENAISDSNSSQVRDNLQIVAQAFGGQLDWDWVSRSSGEHLEVIATILTKLQNQRRDIREAITSYLLKPHPKERLDAILDNIDGWLDKSAPELYLFNEFKEKGYVGIELFFLRCLVLPDGIKDLMKISGCINIDLNQLVEQQMGPVGAAFDEGKKLIQFLTGGMNWELYGGSLREIGVLYAQLVQENPDIKHDIKALIDRSKILQTNPAGIVEIILLFGRAEGIEHVAFIKDDKMRSAVMAYMSLLEVEELEIDYKQVVDILNFMAETKRDDLVKLVPFVLFAPKTLLPEIKAKILTVDVKNPEALFNKAQYMLYRDHLDRIDHDVGQMLLGRYYKDIHNLKFGEEILKAAEHFLNLAHLFQWIQSSETPITRDNSGNVKNFNDFILFLKYSRTMLPEDHARIEKQWENMKNLNPQTIQPGDKLRMCCWEFVMLSLIKAGAITEEDIRKIYTKENLKRNESHLVVQAMTGGASLDNFPMLSEGTAKPGDVLIYRLRKEKPGQAPFYVNTHASIYAGNNEVVELLSDTVRRGNFSKPDLGTIYVIPAEVVARNIKNFATKKVQEISNITLENEVKQYKKLSANVISV